MDLSNTNGDRLYESLNDPSLSEGPLEFPMMGWPFYVRNPSKDLCFNDLRVKAVADYPADEVANISFVGLNYPTMKQVWDLNRELRAYRLSATDTVASPWGATSTFGLTHSVPYKS